MLSKLSILLSPPKKKTTLLAKNTANTSYLPVRLGTTPFSPVTQIEPVAKSPSITFNTLKKTQGKRVLKWGHANQRVHGDLTVIPNKSALTSSQQNWISLTRWVATIRGGRQNKASLRKASNFPSNLQQNQRKFYLLLTSVPKELTQVLKARMSLWSAWKGKSYSWEKWQKRTTVALLNDLCSDVIKCTNSA